MRTNPSVSIGSRPAPRSAGRRTAKQEARTALDTYREKRDFGVTPEPPPERPRERSGESKALEFVVQKHDATRLHYDVRIEVAGAMMSFAVPKGPSYDPDVKRLAVETEDHPTAYSLFEGRIPDGEYGAGDVLIWDRGTYETIPPGQEEGMREKGHILARFYGEKLEGAWHFVRTRAGEAKKAQWLMFKAKDGLEDASLDIVSSRPESVVSGAAATRGPVRNAAHHSLAKLTRAMKSPMRAIVGDTIPGPEGYLFEIKYDGYRILAFRSGDATSVLTRKGNDWTGRFPDLDRALRALAVREVVLDGEACVLDADGVSSFQGLQAWLGGDNVQGAFAFVAFDILWLDGRDLRPLPIEQRIELLSALLKEAKAPFALPARLPEPILHSIAAARTRPFEGVIAKKLSSPYISGGAGTWWKVKFRQQQEVAICGYLRMTGTTDEVGALLIALATKDGGFEFAGKVGTGFNQRTRRSLAQRLEATTVPAPLVNGNPKVHGARWTKIELVAEIEFAEWTRDGSARAASFLGLREDKSPLECFREAGGPLAKGGGAVGHRPGRGSAITQKSVDAKLAPEVTLTVPLAKVTNRGKVLYPRDGITKGDVVSYYESIASAMLPHLSGRPIGLQRWPDGIDAEAWFQQNAPENVPEYVRVIDPGGNHDAKRKLLVDNVDTLVYLVNLAALTIHQWASHIPSGVSGKRKVEAALLLADYTVIDLDPGDGPWEHLVRVAKTLRHVLERLELNSAVKTSGQRGVHILIPFARGPTHADAAAFGRELAAVVAESHADIATVERRKAKRQGRLYIDALQNGDGKTIVAPYTLRAKDKAPVSTPLAWTELTSKLDPSRLNLKTVPARVAKLGDLFASVLESTQKLPAPSTIRSRMP